MTSTPRSKARWNSITSCVGSGLTMLAVVFLVSSCSRQPAAGPAEGKAPSQTLVITGSSTMAPLIEKVAARFQQLHPDVQITVRTGGSGQGIKDVRESVADIGMASRALAESESDLLGIAIARDGICLLVHQDNPVASLTDAQIRNVYTGTVTSWAEVGGLDRPIHVITRDEGRGELELFLNYLNIKKADVKARSSVGDNAVGIKAISSDSDAIVFVSVGEAERSAKAMVPIRLLPTAGVAASSQGIRAGNYPLARPLTLVTKSPPSVGAREFVDFCISSNITDLIRAQDFVPFQD